MVGLVRLDNVQHCVTDVLQRGVPGDLIETGAWRGGTTVFMRAVLKAYGDTERTVVWVADSFQGLPEANPELYPADIEYAGEPHPALRALAVPMEQVQANFRRYGLLDDQVRFLKGWFSDTLPGAPIGRLAVLRLDGDMYESTMTALRWLYPKLSAGGYVIVDDYGALRGCGEAVDDYRRQNDITEEMVPVDWTAVYWQRLR
jgi:O-methyltransferase